MYHTLGYDAHEKLDIKVVMIIDIEVILTQMISLCATLVKNILWLHFFLEKYILCWNVYEICIVWKLYGNEMCILMIIFKMFGRLSLVLRKISNILMKLTSLLGR